MAWHGIVWVYGFSWVFSGFLVLWRGGKTEIREVCRTHGMGAFATLVPLAGCAHFTNNVGRHPRASYDAAGRSLSLSETQLVRAWPFMPRGCSRQSEMNHIPMQAGTCYPDDGFRCQH